MSNTKTWSNGDTVRYITGESMPITPGLFFYSGLGMGDLYRPDGTKQWCRTTEATRLCREDGVDCIHRDKFDGYCATYLGD